MTIRKMKYIHPETEVVYMQSVHLLGRSDPTTPNAGGQGGDTGETSSGEDPNEQPAKRNNFGWQAVGDWDNLNDELR